MNRDFTIHRARAGQGAEVAQLIRRSLPPRLRPLTIWHSPRAARYVEAILRHRVSEADAAFYLLRRGKHIAGLAAFRVLDQHAFLNHLYVAPRWRGRGLGARLLAAAARNYLERHPLGQIALDVFAGNAAVEAWYARLGFLEHAQRTWRLVPPGHAHPSETPPPARCENLAAANRRHRAWGFSTVVIATSAGRLDVGRLYAPYFRLPDCRAAADPELHRTLRALDRSRRCLLIAPSSPPTGWIPLAVSRRLQCPAATLFQRLGGASHEHA